MLNMGAQLSQSYPNYKTVDRRLQTWYCNEVLRHILINVANDLRDRGTLNEEECFIDANFVLAKGGGAKIGAMRGEKTHEKHAIVDRHGLPLSIVTHAANHREVRLVQRRF
jgi:hypothetical protein